MHLKSFTMGAGAAIVVLVVLAYMFYGIQHRRFEAELRAEIAAKQAETEALKSTQAPVSSQPPAPATAAPLSDDEIIRRAEDLGMIFMEESEEPVEPAGEEEEGASAETQEPELRFINVKLFAGMNATDIARELVAASVVENENEFINFLIEKGVANRLKAGSFDFPESASFEEIYRILMQ